MLSGIGNTKSLTVMQNIDSHKQMFDSSTKSTIISRYMNMNNEQINIFSSIDLTMPINVITIELNMIIIDNDDEIKWN